MDIAANVLDQSLFEETGLMDIIRMTDLEQTQIDHFTPTDLKIIIKKCRELNPDFFGMRTRLLNVASKSH